MSFTTVGFANTYPSTSNYGEGNSGASPATFTLTRTGDLSRAATVAWTVTGTGSTPADGADFVGGVLPSGVVAFPSGSNTATITVNVAGDRLLESYETYAVTLSAPSSGTSLGSAVATGDIYSDDHAISLTAESVDKAEGNAGQTLYTFRANFQPGGNHTGYGAEWVVTGSGANPATADDFVDGVLPSGSVYYPPRTNSGPLITVAVRGDRLAEGDEGFTLTLRNPYGNDSVALLTPSAAAVIRNDDASVSIEAGPLAVVEGQSGNALRAFTLTRTGNLSAAQQVSWVVAGAGESAADAADFAGGALPSGTVSFAAGQASATITVAVAGDNQAEADEGFTVTLLPPADGAQLGNRVAAGVIRNDEASLSVAAEAADRPEGQSGTTAFTFAVTRTGDLSVSHGARWAVSGAEGSDFAGGTVPAGQVVFAPGEARRTLTVNVAGDRAPEADESFTVSLFAPTGGATLGVASADGVIRDDDGDAGPVRFEIPIVGGPGVDAARIGGGLRGAAVATADGLPVGVTLGASGPVYALSGVEVLDFADGRLVFDPSDPAAQVVRLFEAALDRAPDQAGLNFYVAAIRGGVALSDIARGFIASPEFGARFGTGLSDDEYVGRLYSNVLGRAASDGELLFYRETLAAGVTREQVLVGFSESAENRALTAPLVGAGVWDRSENAAVTARLYDTMFGRAPDLDGLRFYRDALDAGTTTPLGFVGNFLGSPEFASRYGAGTTNAGLVELLYRNTLDRAASASEVAYYTSQLDAGTLGRAQLVLNFSESPEHQALLAPSVASENPAQFGILFA